LRTLINLVIFLVVNFVVTLVGVWLEGSFIARTLEEQKAVEPGFQIPTRLRSFVSLVQLHESSACIAYIIFVCWMVFGDVMRSPYSRLLLIGTGGLTLAQSMLYTHYLSIVFPFTHMQVAGEGSEGSEGSEEEQ
jgi:hypothetical protein